MKQLWIVVFCLILCSCMSLDTSEMYMRPGALDTPAREIYVRYKYKFLDRYQVSHDFLLGGGCGYRGKPVGIKDILPSQNYAPFAAGEIVEMEGRTYMNVYSKSSFPKSIDRYVRRIKVTVPISRGAEIDRWGHRYIDASKPPLGYEEVEQGFIPICAQGWVGTSHFLSVNLVKLNLSDAIKHFTEPDTPLQEVTIGENTWSAQSTPLAPRKINTIAGSYLSWLLPIGDTGYTFVFELGANEDSLKYPEAHARMQEIFRHLVESVKVEPLPEEERLRYEAEAPQREAQMKAALAAEEKRQADQREKQRLRKEQIKEKCKKIWNWNDIECKLNR